MSLDTDQHSSPHGSSGLDAANMCKACAGLVDDGHTPVLHVTDGNGVASMP